MEQTLGILAGLRRADQKTRKAMAEYVRKISRKVLRGIDPVPNIYKHLHKHIAELEAVKSIPDMPIRYVHIESYQKHLSDGGTYQDWLLKSEIDVATLLKNFILEYKAWRYEMEQALRPQEEGT